MRAQRACGCVDISVSALSCFADVAMPTKFKIFAIAAALAAGTSSAAMAQGGYGRPGPEPTCPAGYALYGHSSCRPVAAPGYGNPVTGNVSGEEAGAANGSKPPAAGPCAAGYVYSLGYCYPAH
jgi:hypothetical protein